MQSNLTNHCIAVYNLVLLKEHIMSKVFKTTFYETPGHGYLKVSGDDAREVKISQSFSDYSFFNEDDDVFYLEEDCDLPLFLKRCELDGVTVEIDEQYLDEDEEESMIRCHNPAEGGDWGYYGALEQNHVGLESFFETDDDYDYEDEDEEEEED